MPLNEVVFDFYDRIKSISSGYASFDYELLGYQPGDLTKLSILVNSEPVDALSWLFIKILQQNKAIGLRKTKRFNTKTSISNTDSSCAWARSVARETIKGYKKSNDQNSWWGARDRKRKF